ncbi:26S proteasome non-ATPase regulatory subunit 8 -like protein A [Cardamine amara subsp. amara]|uniref:26S proteasome non-ATPase regulatory subunit 8 -like protein A n=1 Tax=Cardamine amara subsp. amara TaxID=228776 RepID=A0ABD1ANJ5_CARAN
MSQEISSILVAKGGERDLMAEIMGEEDDLKYDMVVDGWTTILANGETILWTDLLERDMAHRNHPTIATEKATLFQQHKKAQAMDPQLTEVSQQFERFKAVFVRKDYDSCSDLLSKSKVLVTKFRSLPPLFENTPNAAQELTIAREIYEHAVILSVITEDQDAFERDYILLKPYYVEARNRLPPSPQENLILGLNLLRLLVQNRIAEFHTELKLLSSATLENPCIKHSVNDLYRMVRERLAKDVEPLPASLSAEKAAEQLSVFVEKIMEDMSLLLERSELLIDTGYMFSAKMKELNTEEASLLQRLNDKLNTEKAALFQQHKKAQAMDPQLTEVSQQFERFEEAFVRKDYDSCIDLLPKLKVLLTKFRSLPSLFENTPNAAQESTIANDKRIDSKEIVFLDLEWKEKSIVEFGAVVVDADTMGELDTHHTFIKPSDSILQSLQQGRKDRFTYNQLRDASEFSVACIDIYEVLNEKTWIGHNIRRSDVPRLRTAFKDVRRECPEPKYVIDTLEWLTAEFGRRTYDTSMSLEALAKYFGLGEQTHRSLDDCRLNHQIFMKCGSVLALERIYKEQDKKEEERAGDQHRRKSVRQRTK